MPGHRGLTPAEVQGAQSGFNSVTQVLQSLAEQKQRQAQQAIEQQRVDIEQQRAQDEQANRKDLAAKAARQLDLMQKQQEAEQKSRALGDQVTKQQLLHNYELSGIPPSSDDTISMAPGLPGFEQHTAPSLGINTILPSQQMYAGQQADIARIAGAPAQEAEAQKLKEQSDDQQAKQLALLVQTHKDRMDEETRRQTYETNRDNINKQAAVSLRNSEDAASMQRSVIQSTGGLMGIPDKYKLGGQTGVTVTIDSDGNPTINKQNPEDFITQQGNDLRDGNTTIEQVKSKFPKQASMIFKYAADRGITGLTNAQLTQLTNLNDMSKPLNALKGMAQIRAQQGTLFGGSIGDSTNIPFTQANQQFKKLEQEFGQQTAKIASTLGGIRRLNAQDVKLTLDSLIPDKSPNADPMNGFDKYNNFATGIQNDYNTVLQGLNPGQRAILTQKFGGTSFPYLDKTLHTPGAPAGTPSGMTPPAQGTPNQIHWVMQNGKLVQVGQQPQQ